MELRKNRRWLAASAGAGFALTALLALLLISPGRSFAQNPGPGEKPKEKTLYERLGGYDGISGVVEDFLDQLGKDPMFERFGHGRSMNSLQRSKQLIKDQGTRFDPVSVKDFVRSLGLNPPGSILLLSDGSIGRVIEMAQGNLLRPRVRLLIDSYGNVYRDDRGPLLDLSDTPKVFIARPVNFQDLLEAREQQAPG